MKISPIVKALQWVLAPGLAFAMAYQFGGRHSDRLPVESLSSAEDAGVASKSLVSAWHRARTLSDPLDRIQASWSALEELELQELRMLFRQALEEVDHECLAMLGEVWMARDPVSFIEGHFDVPVWASSPPVLQTQMDRAFRIWMKADPAQAFQAFQKLDSQSQLILGGSGGRTLAGELLLAHLSLNPAALAEIDLRVFMLGGSSNETGFSGDVEALARAFGERSLEDGQTERLLGFLQRAILTNDPNEETKSRHLAWWRALPEAMQLQAIPWDAGPEILDHPGLNQRFAQRAMEEVSQVPVYMRHYGKAWAEENPQEAFEWVLARYENETLTGPPFPLTPAGLHSSRIRVNFDHLGLETESFHEALVLPIRALTATDPREAIEAMDRLPYPYLRSRAAIVIAREWAKSDREAALEWSATLPGSYARDQAPARIEERPSWFDGPIQVSP